MVEQHLCSFCGEQIEPGTGKMYVRKDGTVFLFCTNKCYKNMVELKRVPRNITWTKAYAAKKGISRAVKEKAEQKAEEKTEAKVEPKVKAKAKTKAEAKTEAKE
ncbi:MAG: 50S ribosomal protein L24e [Methanomassiliicoccales archaeon]|nr:50S ribosomal protein L24e [Methanomassiliicoccales archaeon]